MFRPDTENCPIEAVCGNEEVATGSNTVGEDCLRQNKRTASLTDRVPNPESESSMDPDCIELTCLGPQEANRLAMASRRHARPVQQDLNRQWRRSRDETAMEQRLGAAPTDTRRVDWEQI
jgi:hypothetical protein